MFPIGNRFALIDMQNQMTSTATMANSGNWTNPLAAIGAMLLPSYDRSLTRLPDARTAPETPPRTVVMLLKNVTLARALRRLLLARNIEVRSVTTAHELSAINAAANPACLVVDLEIANGCGLLLCEQIKILGWRLPVIALSDGSNFRTAVRAMHAGVVDVLATPPDGEEFLSVIERVLVESITIRKDRTEAADLKRRFEVLSPREREILRLVLAGLMNKEIADQLQLALVTIKLHRGRLMRKLKAKNAVDLARLAMTAEFIPRRQPVEIRAGNDDDSDFRTAGGWDAGVVALA